MRGAGRRAYPFVLTFLYLNFACFAPLPLEGVVPPGVVTVT